MNGLVIWRHPHCQKKVWISGKCYFGVCGNERAGTLAMRAPAIRVIELDQREEVRFRQFLGDRHID
jgi:hypothetical protein